MSLAKLPIKLYVDRTNIFKWWVYGYHGVHNNYKGFKIETQTLGKLSNIIKYTKQKINTTISPDTELVTADDITPHETWMIYFLDDQGYKVKETIIYKYNKIEIILENNGKKYRCKWKKHRNIMYFLSPTASSKVNFKSSTVPLKTRSQIISARLCRENFSSSSESTP